MATVATYVRAQQNLPDQVKREILASTDLEVNEAWQGVVEHLQQNFDADFIVKKLVQAGWSYDTAYWLTSQVQLYGSVSPVAEAHRLSLNTKRDKYKKMLYWGAGLTVVGVAFGGFPGLIPICLVVAGWRGLARTPKD